MPKQATVSRVSCLFNGADVPRGMFTQGTPYDLRLAMTVAPSKASRLGKGKPAIEFKDKGQPSDELPSWSMS